MSHIDGIDGGRTNEAIRFSITIKRDAGRNGIFRVMLGDRCIYSNVRKIWCTEWLDENFPGWVPPDEPVKDKAKIVNKVMSKGKKKKHK